MGKRGAFVLFPSGSIRSRTKGSTHPAQAVIVDSVMEMADHLSKWGTPSPNHKAEIHNLLEGKAVWENGTWQTLGYIEGGYVDTMYVERDSD